MKTSTTTSRAATVRSTQTPAERPSNRPSSSRQPDSIAGRRLVFFLNWLRPGAGMINRELAFAEQLAKRGAQVTVLSHFKPQIRPTHAAIRVETLIPTSFRHRWYDHRLTRRLVDFRTRRVLNRTQPELVFTDLPVEAERLLRIRSRLSSRAKNSGGTPPFKVAYTYHGTADGSVYDPATAAALLKQRAFSHRMLRAVDLPIVVSDHLVREARGEGSLPVRIYNGVDLDHWRSDSGTPNHPRHPRVLYVGRYTECKGVLSLVRAFGQAASMVPNAVLEMHGFFERPEYEAKIRDAIAATGVSSRIEMHGPIDFAAIPERIRACTVFANGSVDESFCMPFLEAQACARTCVGFHSRGIPEVVLHDRTGLLAPPNDDHKFAEYLARLLKDHTLRHQFERAALTHAQTFNYQQLTDELIEQLTAHLLPRS